MQYKSRIVIFKIVLGMLLLVLGNVVYARDYAVELIVFERNDAVSTADNAVEEIWNFSSERTAGKLQKMQSLIAKAIAYETSSTLSNLANVRNNLLAAGYGILHSARWIQPARVYQHAPLIFFDAANPSMPYGVIRVYKTSLIYADIDIQYSPTNREIFFNQHAIANVDSDTNLEFQQPHFFISEKRRLKFKEIHYFDHPLFGVILSVLPSE